MLAKILAFRLLKKIKKIEKLSLSYYNQIKLKNTSYFLLTIPYRLEVQSKVLKTARII